MATAFETGQSTIDNFLHSGPFETASILELFVGSKTEIGPRCLRKFGIGRLLAPKPKAPDAHARYDVAGNLRNRTPVTLSAMRDEIANLAEACAAVRSLPKVEIEAVKVVRPVLPTEKALGTQAQVVINHASYYSAYQND